MDPPVVPRDRLDGWQRVAETTDRPFAVGPVSVDASTVRYERTTTAPPRPFFFASRLRITPRTAPNAALTRLVERQAAAGFRDRLADHGIGSIDHREDRSIAIDDPAASRATLSTFRGRCRTDGGAGNCGSAGEDGDTAAADDGTVPVEALLAVWDAGEYLLGGGAYPLSEEPAADRRELLRLIRGVRSPDQ
ncbi:hypothetical protein C461_03862 [Halorubrum aidingense JCM 13560]|uniref:Uncharacterized protein n=1 Tax=Halorubrum aidingense JCM 13560 TaxID=1230454 RepID=M0PFQ8_9EURY|nr:hypothetical protein [Halorubrum aidingense]EMA68733.1 hypothetical protein C461_03862 [Halorubrum aidingense JCM 13560]